MEDFEQAAADFEAALERKEPPLTSRKRDQAEERLRILRQQL